MKCGRGLWIKAVPALAGLIVAGLTVICPDGGEGCFAAGAGR